jgi:predicted amidohydrolase
LKTLIKNGRVIDPSQNIDAIMDLLVEDGVVKEVAAEIKAAADEVYDADGLIVAPGLVDVHTHLREPGNQPSPFTINASSPNVIPCTIGIGNHPTPDLYFISRIGPST